MNVMAELASLENARARETWGIGAAPSREFGQSIQLPKYRRLMDMIIKKVSDKHGITVDEICGPSRKAAFVDARVSVAIEAREHGLSFSKIGFCMGRRDHSTIDNLLRRGVK